VYDIIYNPSVEITQLQKAKAVTIYEGHWHKLEHDIRTKKPYLGIEWLDIHEFDGESLPLDNE
jgi:hypothetical protein